MTKRCEMKWNGGDRQLWRRVPIGVLVAFSLLVRLVPAVGIVGLVTLSNATLAAAHSMAQFDLSLGMTSETQEILVTRGTGIQTGDVLAYVLEVPPGENSSLGGPGGYVTFYPPLGTQVVGASVVKPRGGSFIEVPVTPPGEIPGAAGKANAPYAAPFNANDPFDGGAWEEGTLPQYYGDTGIFYSQSADTAKYVETTFQDGSNQGTTALTASNGYLIKPSACKQLRKVTGKPRHCRTHNLWDASNVSAWGGAADTAANVPGTEPHSTYQNLDGNRGRTAYLAGSPVAGPDTFYSYDHTARIGPWQRIAYPGSTIGVGPPKDRANLNTSHITTSAGITLDEANPLPADTTAVRWSVGGLLEGEVKYLKLDLKVLPTFDSSVCNPVDAEVFGGGAGVGKRGKDNAWRYHVPSPANGNTCLNLHQSGPSEAAKGEEVTFTITASNVATTTLTGVVIEDALPSGTSFVSASPTQESVAGRTVRWPALDLAPGESVSYDVTVKVKSDGTLVNTARANSNHTPPAKAGTQTLIGPHAEVTHTKSMTPSLTNPREILTYTLEIANSGAGEATTLSLEETLDPSLSYVPGSTLINGAAAPDPTRANPHAWLLGTITADTTTTVQFDARVEEALTPGACYYSDYSISWNEALVYGRQTLHAVDTAELCLGDPGPAINVVNSAPATAVVGDSVTYSFTVTNDDLAGDGTDIHNLTVTDDITGVAVFVDGDTNSDSVLQVGEVWNYTAGCATLISEVGELVDTVTVTGHDDSNETVPPGQDTHTTVVTAQPEPTPAMSVTNSGPSTALVGDTVTYSFIVTNDDTNGDGTPIHNLTVTDNTAGVAVFVDGDTNLDSVLQLGETWNYTTTHTPTDTGNLVSTVTVTGQNDSNQPVPPAQDTHTTVVTADPTPSINVVTSGPSTALVGDTVTHTYAVTNNDVNGDGTDIHNLTVTDDITGVAVFVDGDTNLDSILQTGETWNYTTNHTPTDTGNLVTTVTVTGQNDTNQPVPPAQHTHTTIVVTTEPVSIGNYIWNDLNANGTQDPNEPGIEGVNINLLDTTGNTVASIVTVTDGAYTFTGITPGTYVVRVDESTVPADYFLSTASNPLSVTATSGEIVDSADFGYTLAIAPVGEIVGLVIYDGDTRAGLDDSESGIPNVTVNLFDDAGSIAATTSTQPNGSYRFTGVPVGDYLVDVDQTDPDMVDADILTTNNNPQPISAADGQTTVVPDVGYVMPASSLSGTIVHDVNRDGSRDGGEPGLGGIPVVATLLGPDGVATMTPEVSNSTVTADDGSWSFADIAVGDYIIEFDPSGVPHGLTSVSFSNQTISIPPATAVAALDAGLVGSSALGNLIFGDINKNGILDGQETGLADVSVSARWFGPDGLDGTSDDIVYAAVSDAQGGWGIRQIPAGTYAVTISSATLPNRLSGKPRVTTTVAANAISNVDLGVVPAANLAFTGGGAMNLVLVGLFLLLAGSGALYVTGNWRRRKFLA